VLEAEEEEDDVRERGLLEELEAEELTSLRDGLL
jgi:hypothetical protein